MQSVVIPEVGHFVAEEAPAEMLATLTTFLAPYRDGEVEPPKLFAAEVITERHRMITEGEPIMHSAARRAAKALAGLVVAAGLALAAAPPGSEAPAGEGATVKQIFNEKLPNVPGKTLTVRVVDYRPGGVDPPHRHPASGFVFVYVLSGAIRSQVEGEPLGVYRAGQSWTEPPNAHHLVSANASKTEPARLVAFVIADDGVAITVYDK